MPASKTKVLMLAFELPPFNSGGLGEACLGLTKALSKVVDITFLLPTKLDYPYTHMKLIFGDEFATKKELAAEKTIFKGYENSSYKNLEILGIEKVSKNMVDLAMLEDFDLIHAHDWMTVKAAIQISQKKNVPWIFQLHSTEVDRSPIEYIDKQKYDLEKLGIEKATRVITVSNYTKKVVQEYFHNTDKIDTVYNAITLDNNNFNESLPIDRPIILSLGRITYQKGLDNLLNAARIVVDEVPQALFVIVGDGDKTSQLIEYAGTLGLSGNVVFTGFLRGKERELVYNSASVFMMPSISEPFGLVAVEAASKGIPTILSKQSGVCEILKGSKVVDYWDSEKMAKYILKILKSKKHQKKIVDKQNESLKNISWENSASTLNKIYTKILT